MLLPQKDIADFCRILRAGGKKIVFTNGCFDILHAGHVRYLEKAKAFGDVLVLGLNSDASVRANKGPSRPINSEMDRAEVVGALASVDAVVLFDELTAESIIAKVRPDVYVKGGDYTLETLPEAKIVQSYGGRVEFVSLVAGRSTTNVIEKIRAEVLTEKDKS
ncbi:D-glycero-beta-D-manno-heptose 1-phosphate adenylyltransferase [Selenomonas sp.]|uniref:D-glycero-beta-D-manno-heptose 1-phosphate adenylyltransferase n=1 Tax=Selenomonas sp. TaxID=2053611 RepID=UPI0025DB67E5|nr:D-glycero-beta-D-manno-heptose 1-phosphate adenylyltransferase [Selenomonas sp.]MCI6086631.1 D-glycero-beta-D-manno-heptose 1-phosphate adenylyltransferase [Selenomonas sp.]MDY3297419.1 D-glycero-beta-D-manno-heptose 1-phosphate adenylyltransferase [Selenomonas sp.]MDY4415052.1 D-glycero-beta-D-manno-heptose 1-phosphate adenylyltransferase [Selenomonas sp.]